MAVAAVGASAGAWGQSPGNDQGAIEVGTSSEGVEFDLDMLSGGRRSKVDLAVFERGNAVPAGRYNVDLYVNRSWVGRHDVRLGHPKAGVPTVPCMTPNMLQLLQLAEGAVQWPPDADQTTACVALGELAPGTAVDFDLSRLRMDITVPQALLGREPRRYVDPASWQEGIPALFANYDVNANHSQRSGTETNSLRLRLDTGLNLGAWRFRHEGNGSWDNGVGGDRRWKTVRSYAQRHFAALRSTLTLGDLYTDGAVFDSLALRGAELATADRMLPPSRRGFAPIVRGTAETNAEVSIRQNGSLLYRTMVPPGPFVIDDLYATGFGGDLEVTVTEADGRVQRFLMPYGAVPQLLRSGMTRHDVALGQLRGSAGAGSTPVAQAVLQHGVSDELTVYGGVQAAQQYVSILGGTAFNTRAGALALDATVATARARGGVRSRGERMRLSWSKSLPQTQTVLDFAARYMTDGYQTIDRAHRWRNEVSKDSFGWWRQAERMRFSLAVNQPLDVQDARLYANASMHKYWGNQPASLSYQLGYSGTFKLVNYNLMIQRLNSGSNGWNTSLGLYLSIPLGRSSRSPRLLTSHTVDTRNGVQQQATLSSTLGEYGQLNWSMTAAHANQGRGSSGFASMGYQTPWSALGLGYSVGRGYSQLSGSARGALLVHGGGLTLGRQIGDSAVLVHAPGATGARVQNGVNLRVDSRGYALISQVTPYELQNIQLDPGGLPLGVELGATGRNIALYQGAVARVDFETKTGRAVIATLHTPSGQLVPFGSRVLTPGGEEVGIVGQGGRALLRVSESRGKLELKLDSEGRGGVQTCGFDYDIPADAQPGGGYASMEATCETF